MKKTLLASFLITLLFACDNKEKPDTNNTNPDTEIAMVSDSIIYKIKTVKDEYCITNSVTKDTLCSESDASYLVLQRGFNDAATQKMQTELMQMISGDSLSIAEGMISFNHEIDEYKGDETDFWPMGYASSDSQKTELNTPELFTGSSFSYSYTGGAHGNYYTENFNFNAQTGERMPWQSLFTDTLQVYAAAQKSLAKIERLGGEDIFEYFWFPEDKFYLTNNYLLSADSMTFVYGIYEIASYADGEIEISLKYEDIKGMLKEGTALQFYLENKR